MSTTSAPTEASEVVYLDLSNVPLKPVGKKEITQLEVALIIGSLFTPEILKLLKDPIERVIWMDSLAVAAAAFARSKAGIPISQISEELGRSEITIRSHLTQKTVAGRIVAETYEKIKSGQLKIVLPITGITPADTETLKKELEALREELSRLRSQLEEREREASTLRTEIETLRNEINNLKNENERLRSELTSVINERDILRNKLARLLEKLEEMRRVIEESENTTSESPPG